MYMDTLAYCKFFVCMLYTVFDVVEHDNLQLVLKR